MAVPPAVFSAPFVLLNLGFGGRVPADAAMGRLSAELLCPYPPGVPVALPGEAISAETLATLQAVLAAGGKVIGAADETLRMLRVIVERKR